MGFSIRRLDPQPFPDQSVPEGAVLDHVAILVRSLDASYPFLAVYGLAPEGVRHYPGEGTKEAYVSGGKHSGRLLLIEATGPGPYARALAKRGPGLHHVALSVASLPEYARLLPPDGWRVHPYSFRGGGSLVDLWLCRTGFPALIEVLAPPDLAAGPSTADPLISAVELPLAETSQVLLDALRCRAIRRSFGPSVVLHTLVGALSVDALSGLADR